MQMDVCKKMYIVTAKVAYIIFLVRNFVLSKCLF